MIVKKVDNIFALNGEIQENIHSILFKSYSKIIWDVHVVLTFLSSQEYNNNLIYGK